MPRNSVSALPVHPPLSPEKQKTTMAKKEKRGSNRLTKKKYADCSSTSSDRKTEKNSR